MIPVLKLRDEAALAPLGGYARKEECKSRIAYAWAILGQEMCF